MPNVFLITIDCLRYDYFENLMNIIKQNFSNCYIFKNLYSTGSWTTPSFYSLFTNLYPFEGSGFLPLPASQVSLAEIMRKNGFTTCGIHSNYYLSSIFNYDKGFDYYYDLRYQMFLEKELMSLRSTIKNKLGKIVKFIDKLAFLLKIDSLFQVLKNRQYEKVRKQGTYRFTQDASVITKKAIRFLKKHARKKNFIWLHYMDLHYPLKNPKCPGIDITIRELNKINDKIRVRLSHKNDPESIPETEKMIWRSLYEKNLRFVGDQINLFFKKIMEFRIKDPIIIITSDHGELLFEHGMVFHGFSLYDENIHIPCIIWKQDFAYERIIDDLYSNVDIAPTIMNLCNINHATFQHGISMLDQVNQHQYVIAYTDSNRRITLNNQNNLDFEQYCIRTKKWKYILERVKMQESIYNLIDDPHENNDLIKSCPREIKRYFDLEMEKLLEKNGKSELTKLNNAAWTVSSNFKS